MTNERIFEYIWIAVLIERGFSTKRHAINAEAFDSGTIALQCERLSASFLGHPFACLPPQVVVVVVVVAVTVVAVAIAVSVAVAVVAVAAAVAVVL